MGRALNIQAEPCTYIFASDISIEGSHYVTRKLKGLSNTAEFCTSTLRLRIGIFLVSKINAFTQG